MTTTFIARATLLCLVAMLAATGCGGSREKSPMRDVQLGDGKAPTRGTLVAALGDSIAAGSPLWDPEQAVRDSIGSQLDPESQFEYWAQLRIPATRWRNCGVFGERTDQIAARLPQCAKDAEVLVVQGGINDIAQMRRVKTAARNLRGIVKRGKAMHLRVALVEVLPWNNGYPGADRRIRRLNKAIHAIGADEHVPVYPWYRQLEDPRRPGKMKAAWTIDGDHPSVAGYKRLAEVVKLP